MDVVYLDPVETSAIYEMVEKNLKQLEMKLEDLRRTLISPERSVQVSESEIDVFERFTRQFYMFEQLRWKLIMVREGARHP